MIWSYLCIASIVCFFISFATFLIKRRKGLLEIFTEMLSDIKENIADIMFILGSILFWTAYILKG